MHINDFCKIRNFLIKFVEKKMSINFLKPLTVQI